MFSSLVKNSRRKALRIFHRSYNNSKWINTKGSILKTDHSLSLVKSATTERCVYSFCSFNVPYMIQRRFNSTAELREITNNSKLLLLLQSGKYEDLIEEIKVKYREGFYLSRNDFSTFVHRFSEFKRYDLVNELYILLKEYESPLLLEFAPLFCYNLILSGDIQGAFSMLSSSSDQLLVAKSNDDSTHHIRDQSSSRLPQEYLIVRLCIQLMSDVMNLSGKIQPFTQSLPRRSREIDFTEYFQSMVTCYVYEWIYLTNAIHRKQESNQAEAPPQKLKDLWASPYTPLAGNSRSLEECAFSSFTLRFSDQRLQSTLRSLELLLWYFYSRSVYDVNTVRQQRGDSTISDTIESVFSKMKNQYDFWNPGVFQFFIFYYSQPTQKSLTSSQICMRDGTIVNSLLHELKSRDMKLSPSFIEMLLRKRDMPLESLQLLFSFVVNKNLSPVELNRFMEQHSDLLVKFASEYAKRNANKELRQFVDELFYLNISFPERVLNQLLIIACYMRETDLKKELLHKASSKHFSPESVCSCIFEGVLSGENVDNYLKMIDTDSKWDVLLLHLLMNIKATEQLDKEQAEKVVDFCKSRNISFSSELTKQLYCFYRDNCDYKNIINLFDAIKRDTISVDSAFFREMEDTVNLILKSKSRLFGPSRILDLPQLGSKGKWLSRPNNKYNNDKAFPPLGRALAIFMEDEKFVSINTIIESTVKTYCETSILNYGTWI